MKIIILVVITIFGGKLLERFLNRNNDSWGSYIINIIISYIISLIIGLTFIAFL